MAYRTKILLMALVFFFAICPEASHYEPHEILFDHGHPRPLRTNLEFSPVGLRVSAFDASEWLEFVRILLRFDLRKAT